METVESAQPMEAGRTEIPPSQHAAQTPCDTLPIFDALGPEHLALREFTATDSQRRGLAALHVEDGVAYATDGSIALSVPTTRVAQSDLPVIEGMGDPAAMGLVERGYAGVTGCGGLRGGDCDGACGRGDPGTAAIGLESALGGSVNILWRGGQSAAGVDACLREPGYRRIVHDQWGDHGVDFLAEGDPRC